MRILMIALLLGLLSGGVVQAQGDFKPNDDGFIRNWVILAPIPLDAGQSGADGLGKQQVPDEARLHPKDGEKITVGDKELAWKKYEADDYFINFNTFLGRETENSVGYAVCYLVADKEMPALKMKTGSDDQGKIYLNGKEIWKNSEARALEKDQDTTEDVTLKEGTNTLVFKVVNEGMDWSGCVRFIDKDGNPVKNLKVLLARP